MSKDIQIVNRRLWERGVHSWKVQRPINNLNRRACQPWGEQGTIEEEEEEEEDKATWLHALNEGIN